MSVRFKGPAGAQISVTGLGGKTRVIHFDDDGISEPIGDDAIIHGLDDDGNPARRLTAKEQERVDAADARAKAKADAKAEAKRDTESGTVTAPGGDSAGGQPSADPTPPPTPPDA